MFPSEGCARDSEKAERKQSLLKPFEAVDVGYKYRARTGARDALFKRPKYIFLQRR